MILKEKNLGVKVLPGREFTEQRKTSEKMQAPGDVIPCSLAIGHPSGQGSKLPGNS